MPAGRPSDYTQELADHICVQLSEGLSLRRICKADDMPAISSVFKWLRDHKEFSDQYARAREAQADTLADEIQDIADDSAGDLEETENGVRVNHENVNRSRLRVDARKWIAAKLKPKRYGDKLELGSDPNSPFIVNVVRYADSNPSK